MSGSAVSSPPLLQLLKSLTKTQKFKFLMKTHLRKKIYYFGSTPVFYPNKIQIFSPCFKAILSLLLLQRRCFIKSQAEAQSPSPGPLSPCRCQCPHPVFAEGTSQRQNGAQRDKDHLEKKNIRDVGCIEYASLTAHRRGSPELGNRESRPKHDLNHWVFPLLSQKQELHPCEQERPPLIPAKSPFSPSKAEGASESPRPHPGVSVQDQSQKPLRVWVR